MNEFVLKKFVVDRTKRKKVTHLPWTDVYTLAVTHFRSWVSLLSEFARLRNNFSWSQSLVKKLIHAKYYPIMNWMMKQNR